MAAQRSYYEILGVGRTASLEEIKKRYRELARLHHPDVSRDKAGSAKLFAEITTAYKALSHPDERAVYDADLSARERRAQAGATRAAAGTYGSAPPTPGRADRSPTPRPSAPNSPGAPPIADTAALVAQAQAAFVRGKFVEARALCEQVLRRDRRNAAAYELLGDVCRLQGRTDDAVHMYTMALQFNPRNQTVMQRLERLSRPPNSAYSGPPPGVSAQDIFFDNRATGQRGGRPPRETGTRTSASPRDAPDKRPLATLIVGVIGYGLTFLLILYAALFPGRPLRDAPVVLAPISSWSVTLITVMALIGLVLGVTLAATAAIRRIDDELVLPGARASGGAFLPIGLVLIVVSVLSFYAAALLYTILGFLQESFTPSMARVFGAVIAVVLLLTAVYDPGRSQVFFFGGNVVFLALLIGWALGDFFRPDGF